MDIDDKELFSSAMTDEPISEVATEAPAEQPAAETPQQDGRPRDEHGRFVSSQPEPQPETQAADEQSGQRQGFVPSGRLKEEREARDALQRRYDEDRAFLQRQIEALQRQSQPKPEPKPAPDLFENPDGFVQHQLQQGLSPLEQRLQAQEARMQAQLEYTSRRDAFKEYGEEAVRGAYGWLADGVQRRDPDVLHIYNQVMQSEHPYDAAVQAYKRVSIMQQIQKVGDLDKWAVQRAQELAGVQQQQGRQASNQPQGSITKLPPSLRNTPSARAAGDDDPNDMSDAALFRHAMR